MDKLTLKESILVSEANEQRQRRSDLTYVEKKVKTEIDRVIIELTGAESGALTKLAGKYDRLNNAIKLMSEKKNELNVTIKDRVEELFAVEDVVLTRVIETVSFTMTVSKKARVNDKVTIDYEAISLELAKLIPEELQAKVEEITKAYTTVAVQSDKSPALTVKSKVTEGVITGLKDSIVKLLKQVVKSISSWALKYDRKLAALKKTAKI